jgi:serine/threonine-protein kinase
MGTVWLAERADGALQRQVALKLPLYGWARGVAERLQQERDALAGLEHPNIARLYDAGATEAGRPYLAMEFIDGLPIDEFAREHALAVRARVQLFQQVAQAVGYAHGRLIVHRDLKPSNILVNKSGEARLLDFGAAKLLCDDSPQDSALTRDAGRAMSPDYASPEQIRGDRVTVATDVYSLGVVLFELLTGVRPYSLSPHSSAALAVAIGAAEVPLPSTAVGRNRKLGRELRGDLDNIIAKALKKSPRERYRTVCELSDDLQRWLDNEPVRARRDSVLYRMRKFAGRNRMAVAGGALVLTSLAAASVITSMEMLEARRQRDEARLQAKRAEAEERFANMVMEQTGPSGRPLTREEMIDRSVELLDEQYGNDPRFIANALIPISGRYMDLGNTDKELAALQKAEGIARRLGDEDLLVTVQCNTVETELARGRVDRATERLREARELLAASRRPPVAEVIDCTHAEATLANARGDHGTAVERINRAITLQERVDRTSRTYRALLSHAQMLYLLAGRPRDAYTVIDKTLALLNATDAQDSVAIAGAAHNQAVALYQMGEVSDALARERAVLLLRHVEGGEEPVDTVIATTFARLLTRLGDPVDGASWALRAVESGRQGGNLVSQVFAETALAEAQQGAGRVKEAVEALHAAAALLPAQSEPRLRVAVARAQALVALRESDLPRAVDAATTLLRLVGYPDLTRVAAAQCGDLQLLIGARVALAAGRPADAELLSEAALKLAGQISRHPEHSATVGEARLLLALAREAHHDPNGARDAIRGARSALSIGLLPRHPLVLEATAVEARLAARFPEDHGLLAVATTEPHP